MRTAYSAYSACSTLLASLVILCATAGCLGEVGGDRKPGSGSGEGSGSDEPEVCDKLEKDVVIRSTADMAALPKTGCYDIIGKLTIQGPAITSLAGLNDINSVDELELASTGLVTIDTKRPLGIYGRLVVTSNARLTNLEPLSFEIPPDEILIDHNDVLATLEPLALADPRLEQVNGDLRITANAALGAVPLTNLTRVGGALTITGNATVKSVDLSKLKTAGEIELIDNPQLASIPSFAVTEIGGDFTIRRNTALASIGTMASLYRVTGNVTIDANPALTNLAAFTTSIQFIDGALTITGNQNLVDLGALKHMQLIGAITITNNKALLSCRALEIDRCVVHPLVSVINSNKEQTCTPVCE